MGNFPSPVGRQATGAVPRGLDRRGTGLCVEDLERKSSFPPSPVSEPIRTAFRDPGRRGGRNPGQRLREAGFRLFPAQRGPRTCSGTAERLPTLQGQETGLRAISADEARNGDAKADDGGVLGQPGP